ncbi:DUF4064 domain-containing protein [Aquibacillus saliphilus]|uniref:DUF4064 domain-containing protein n=1 Tax=Aquibacillus saliphilus TaxID=1909422 RepID=UPI001CF07B68
MRRTGEVILGVSGLIINAFISLFTIVFLFAIKREGFRNELHQLLLKNEPVRMQEIEIVLAAGDVLGWVILIGTFIGIVLGLKAVSSLKENENPRRAGILYIIAAVLSTLLTVGIGWLSGMLFLIAGTLCFVRRD